MAAPVGARARALTSMEARSRRPRTTARASVICHAAFASSWYNSAWRGVLLPMGQGFHGDLPNTCALTGAYGWNSWYGRLMPEERRDKITIVIAEDEDLYRDLLVNALSSVPTFHIVAAVADANEAQQ